jgi:hypothetical protein
MYQIKNKIYADAGHVLKCNNTIAYNFKDVDIDDVSEIKINIDDMFIENGYVRYTSRLFMEKISTNYSELKKRFINKQFTNDDQLAIILNKDDSNDDLLLFNKMQE